MSQAMAGKTDLLSMEGHVYVAEQEIIQRLARRGPAIFLGHCAAEALKEEKSMVKVYIRCSDEEEKRKRILEDYGIAKEEVDAIRKKFDKKRSNYYQANTQKRWEDMKNYDIVLDSATLGIDGCVDMLECLVSKK